MGRLPRLDSEPIRTQTQLQQIVDTVETLSQRDRETLLSWMTSLTRPMYARSISKLAMRSPTLVLVSAAALYSAMFSPAPGASGDREA